MCCRRDRQPGAFSRAGPDPQGRPGNRLARRRAGRRHRGVRDAEHRSAHDHGRGARRQGQARAITACIAISPSISAPRARTPTSWRTGTAARRLRGVKVFMGSSTGSLLIEDDDGVRAVLKTIRRRAAFHSEDEYRLRERMNLRVEGDPALASGLARRDRGAHVRRSAWSRSRARPASACTCCTSRPRRKSEFLPTTRTSPRSRRRPQHLTLAAPGLLRAARHAARRSIRRSATPRHRDGAVARRRAGRGRRARLRPRAAYARGEGARLIRRRPPA